jgi:hypothetical protein
MTDSDSPLVYHLETDLKLSYTLGKVVFYKHPDYPLQLIGRVISLLSHKPFENPDKPDETQTLDNSFAVIHQMDWIEQAQFSDLRRIRVPGILEFIDTNRSIEVPLQNIIRHFPCFEVLDTDDYTQKTILKEFTKIEKEFNPIIVKNFLICDWEPSVLHDQRFLAGYDDIIPCCSPLLTVLWESADLSDPVDDFYNSCIPEILHPLITPETRKYSIPHLWSDIVAQNPEGLVNNRNRNRLITKKKIPGREENLMDPRVFPFLLQIVKDLQTMKQHNTPAAVVALYLKKLNDDLLPKFIDVIDSKVISLTKKDDSDDEEDSSEEEPDDAREDTNTKPSKRQRSIIEEEALEKEDEEEEEEEEDAETDDEEEEDEWDSSEEDTDKSGDGSTDEDISVYSDTEETENFLG